MDSVLSRPLINCDQYRFDRSVRSKDPNGFLHVSLSNISKAAVNPYMGNEIPNAEELGLDPKRIYMLLRDPEELKKAAHSFNGVPLMSVHKPVFADDSHAEVKPYVVGSTGNSAAFHSPYLTNALTIWDPAAIDGVESKEQAELSCGYTYRADMTPGVFEGIPYDGVMRDIKGNHLALVDAGRAGSDVVVGDAAIPKREGVNPKAGTEKYGSVKFADQKNKKYPIDTPEHVRAAKSYWGKPKNKAKYDSAAQKTITKRIDAAAKKFKIGQYAADRNPKEAQMGKELKLTPSGHRVCALLTGMLAPRLAADKGLKPGEVKGVILGMDAMLPKGLKGSPLSGNDQIRSAVRSVFTPRLAKDASLDDVTELLDKLEDDDMEDGDGDYDVQALGADEDEVDAMDGVAEQICAALEGKVGPEVIEAIKGILGGASSGEDKKPPIPPAVQKEVKPAMDEATVNQKIKLAVDAAEKKGKALAQALTDVKPLVGELVAMDSAEQVYELALDRAKIDRTGVEPSAFRALFLQSQKLAKDSKPTLPQAGAVIGDSDALAALKKMLPNANIDTVRSL